MQSSLALTDTQYYFPSFSSITHTAANHYRSVIHLVPTKQDSSRHKYAKLERISPTIFKWIQKHCSQTTPAAGGGILSKRCICWAWLFSNKGTQTFTRKCHPLSVQIRGHNRDHWWFRSAKTHGYSTKSEKWEDCDSQIKEKPRSGIWSAAVTGAAEIPRIRWQRDAAGFPRQRLVLTFLNQLRGPGRETRAGWASKWLFI